MRRKRRPEKPQHRTAGRIAVKNLAAPPHLNSPRDDRLVALEVGLIQGTVSVVGPRSRWPRSGCITRRPSIASAHRSARSPRAARPFVLRVLEGAMVWHVYRDESGALVMYDDYAAYLVALELGCQMVGAKILGEAAS